MRLHIAFWFFTFALIGIGASHAVEAPILTPIAQVPGKRTDVRFDVNSAEGALHELSDFDPSQFDELYFGPWPNEPLRAGFDANLVPLEFLSVDGPVATFYATTIWNLPEPLLVPLRCLVEVGGLGPSPWLDATSVGLPLELGAVVSNPAGMDFSLLFKIEADYGSGFVPLDEHPPQSVSVRFGSQYGFAAYVVRPIPEPSTALLLGIGFAALICGAAGRRRLGIRRCRHGSCRR